jgi:adenine-specific DNA methylase
MKKPNSTELIDFDSGDTVVDPVLNIRREQSRLYQISNPYIGNKRKILADIGIALQKNNYEFNSVLDLFSGSSVVGIFFKLLNKKVFSNDILTSSYYNALSFVENNNITLSEEDILFLCEHKNNNKNDFVQANYETRFDKDESLFLDNYRSNVNELCLKSQNAREQEIYKSLAIVAIEHYVMEKCFLGGRLNNGQILAKLEHRLNHQKNDGYKMSFKIKSPVLFPSFNNHQAFNLDCLDAMDKCEADLVYIDPPYGQSQSDYAFMFSFCEEYIYSQKINTLSHLVNSKKFIKSKDYEIHFCKVLEKAKKYPKWVISYNNSSWADIETLKKIISEFKKNIFVININYEYNYRKNDSNGIEYLILCH